MDNLNLPNTTLTAEDMLNWLEQQKDSVAVSDSDVSGKDTVARKMEEALKDLFPGAIGEIEALFVYMRAYHPNALIEVREYNQDNPTIKELYIPNKVLFEYMRFAFDYALMRLDESQFIASDTRKAELTEFFESVRVTPSLTFCHMDEDMLSDFLDFLLREEQSAVDIVGAMGKLCEIHFTPNSKKSFSIENEQVDTWLGWRQPLNNPLLAPVWHDFLLQYDCNSSLSDISRNMFAELLSYPDSLDYRYQQNQFICPNGLNTIAMLPDEFKSWLVKQNYDETLQVLANWQDQESITSEIWVSFFPNNRITVAVRTKLYLLNLNTSTIPNPVLQSLRMLASNSNSSQKNYVKFEINIDAQHNNHLCVRFSNAPKKVDVLFSYLNDGEQRLLAQNLLRLFETHLRGRNLPTKQAEFLTLLREYGLDSSMGVTFKVINKEQRSIGAGGSICWISHSDSTSEVFLKDNDANISNIQVDPKHRQIRIFVDN